MLQGAANRDPEAFDRPDELDLRRSDNTPLSFGWGIHHCIGAALARMEGEIAFNALLARFGTIELASDEPHWRPSFTLRGLLDSPYASRLDCHRRRRPLRRSGAAAAASAAAGGAAAARPAARRRLGHR